MKVNNKTILVTGAGSGLGQALTLNLINRGASVAAVDISEEGLKDTVAKADTTKEKLSTHIVDLTQKDQIKELPEKVLEAHGQIDGVINNAGIIQPFVSFNDLKVEKIEQVMQVNFFGTMYVLKAFLPLLLERPEAHIINISSMGGFFPVPGQTIYGASKAAIKLLTEGLNSELKDSNVKVTVVMPGGMDTNIMKNSKVEMTEAMKKMQGNSKTLSAEKAADSIVKSIEKNKVRVFIGRDAKAMNAFYRLAPGLSTKAFAKYLGSKLMGK